MQNKTAIKVGYWSSLATGGLALIWTITFIVQIILVPPAEWSGVENYARAFSFIHMLNLAPALPLGWAFIVMMASIYACASEEKKIWALIGLAFGILYATMANINYLIQLVAVRGSLLSNETKGLELFIGDNPHSVFWALANAYAIQSMAMLFAAWVFPKGRLENWIRGLFIAVGVTFPFQFLYSLGFIPMTIAMPILGIWIIGVPLSSFLLAALFRQADRRSSQ